MSEMITYRLFEASMTALSQLYLLTFYHAGILSFFIRVDHAHDLL
ncbi:hypothetical protein [Vibrio parahaemolyticus]|nr:hypothetical protein [Vibrio parahaemolyticus]